MKSGHTIILTCFVILISAFVYNIFVIDPHLNWKIKLTHYLGELFAKYIGLRGNFSRDRLNKLKDSGLLFAKHKTTNSNYINGVLIEDAKITSIWSKELDKNITINAQVFHPELFKNEKLPVMLHIHGGGFVIDTPWDRSNEFCKLGMIVVSLDYRLAPEYKFPTALEDAYSALSFIFDKKHPLLEKADLSKVVVIGDSAGGNLAATLANAALYRRPNKNLKISHQILIYPTMVHRNMTESKTKFQNGYILSKSTLDWFHEQYIENEEDYNNPLANPLMSKSFENLPPTLIILATDDILHSEGLIYGEALKKANVEVEIKEYISVHGFFSFFGLDAEEIEAFNYISDYLRRNRLIN